MQRLARGLRFTQTDLTKRSVLVRLSNVSRRGKSVAVSAVSDNSKVKQVGKRVPVDERRAMVESYAIKYKAMNGGKFPNASKTKKEVGGSYYVIKIILHDMDRRSKAPNMDAMHGDALRKDVAGVNQASANYAEVSTSHPKILCEEVIIPKTTVDGDDVDLDFSDLKGVGAEQETKTSTLALVEEVLRLERTDSSSSYIGTLKLESEAEREEMVDHLHSEGRHSQRQQHNPFPESDKHDLTKGISLIGGSNISECGDSVAASVVSDDSKVKKVGKIVHRDERRIMVESYVIKFKEMNGGKFPTVSETKKQVGGSYYVIRSILQEIKHRLTAPPTDPIHKTSANVTPVSTDHPIKKTLSEEVVNPKTTVDNKQENLGFSNPKCVGSEQELNTSTLPRKTLTEEVVNLKSTASNILNKKTAAVIVSTLFPSGIIRARISKKRVECDNGRSSINNTYAY